MMARRRKKRKTRSNRWIGWVVCLVFLLAALYYYRPWEYFEEDVFTHDSQWPYKDETSGRPYSRGYDGIDISRHQGRIHWEVLSKNRDIQLIYVKATEGRRHKDSRYAEYIREARKAGFKVGSYHFLRKGSGKEQFEHFRKVVDRGKQDILPMVDVEAKGTRGMSRSEIQKTLKEFVTEAKAYYGKSPVIYSNEAYYKKYLSPEFDNYYLFIANYNRKPVLPGKVKYDLWQYSEKGRVRGIWTWVDLIRLASGRRVRDLEI